MRIMIRDFILFVTVLLFILYHSRIFANSLETNKIIQQTISDNLSYWNSDKMIDLKLKKRRLELKKRVDDMVRTYNKEDVLLQLSIAHSLQQKGITLSEEEYKRQVLINIMLSQIIFDMSSAEIIQKVAPYCEMSNNQIRYSQYMVLDMATTLENTDFKPIIDYIIPYSNNPPKSLVFYLLSRDRKNKTKLDQLYLDKKGNYYDWYTDLLILDDIQRNPHRNYNQKFIDACKTNQYNVIRETAVALEKKYSLKYGQKDKESH